MQVEKEGGSGIHCPLCIFNVNSCSQEIAERSFFGDEWQQPDKACSQDGFSYGALEEG